MVKIEEIIRGNGDAKLYRIHFKVHINYEYGLYKNTQRLKEIHRIVAEELTSRGCKMNSPM